jgi:hypothetical protein
MTGGTRSGRQMLVGIHQGIHQGVDTVRDRTRQTLLWRVRERMLEIEFVDGSVALAGPAREDDSPQSF